MPSFLLLEADDVTPPAEPATVGRGGGGGIGRGRKKDREYTGSAKLSNPVTEAEIRAVYDEVLGITPVAAAQPTQTPFQRAKAAIDARRIATAEKAAREAAARIQDDEDAILALLLVA